MKKIIRTIIKETGVIKRWLRREYYISFKSDYIREQLRKRKGICGKHGCCDLSIFHKSRRCLSKEDRTKCLRKSNLPIECKIYPFDEKDKIPETRSYCNFYWDKKDRKSN